MSRPTRRRPFSRHSGRGGSGARALNVKLRKGRGRKASSARWLERQLNDPYVQAAQRAGYRSRAAFKLAEIDDKHGLLEPGQVVLDLGAAPGGWSQVAAARVKAGEGAARVVAVDLADIEPVAGVETLKIDFLGADAPGRIRAALAGAKADVVLSDMAAPATGHRKTDHLRVMGLCEAAVELAVQVLAPGGVFLAKVLQGGAERELLERMRRDFATVRHVKPKASRADSAEQYVLARGYRGGGGQGSKQG